MKYITTLFLLISSFSYSQKTVKYDKCKFQKDEYDKFTKESVKQTKGKAIFMNLSRSVVVQGFKVDNRKYLEITVIDNHLFGFKEGGSFMLMLDDEEVVDLKFENSIVADYINAGSFDIWKARVLFSLNEEIFNKLVKSNVYEFRYYTSDGYVEKKIKEKYINNIASVLKCIE
ncbi:hypothetical protein [Aquimarina sp. AU119]|uniref:hypothetical protein n=1 Tax=Aquimarina sp. AU119 TaxID=2108528 RepID=UPI000D69C225|nr:hypothetical protein [Aquimarina sp. AU119]